MVKWVRGVSCVQLKLEMAWRMSHADVCRNTWLYTRFSDGSQEFELLGQHRFGLIQCLEFLGGANSASRKTLIRQAKSGTGTYVEMPFC